MVQTNASCINPIALKVDPDSVHARYTATHDNEEYYGVPPQGAFGASTFTEMGVFGSLSIDS